MHKFSKLAVILMALLTAHGTGFWLRRPAGRCRSAGEGLHLTATTLFGAGIWLVAQIYHIDGHYPKAFLIWSLGAMTMAWVSRSRVLLATTIGTFMLILRDCNKLDLKSTINGCLLVAFI